MSMMDELQIGAGTPAVMPELDCKLNVCVAKHHYAHSECKFYKDHGSILGEKIRQQREGTGIEPSDWPDEVPTGHVRVYISSGQHLHARPHDGSKSTTGHTWHILDIPEDLYKRQKKIIAEYDAIQMELRNTLTSSKRYCACGSDHADLAESSDW